MGSSSIPANIHLEDIFGARLFHPNTNIRGSPCLTLFCPTNQTLPKASCGLDIFRQIQSYLCLSHPTHTLKCHITSLLRILCAPSSTLPLSSTPTQPNGNSTFYHDTCARGHDRCCSCTYQWHLSTQLRTRIPKPKLVRVEVVVKAFRASLERRIIETWE